MRRDPNRTELIFELNVALAGDDYERQFQAFLAEPHAEALLARRPSLLDALSDFDGLRDLPKTSLGNRFVVSAESSGLTPDGLRAEARRVLEFRELHPGLERTWFVERNNAVHDLLHILTGYGQDPAGEAALLAFYDGWQSQRRRMRVVRFGMVAAMLSAPRGSRRAALQSTRAARARGKAARISLSYGWEGALARPVERVREELRIAPSYVHHPDGVIRGDLRTAWAPAAVASE